VNRPDDPTGVARLLSAYRRLCDRHPVPVWLTLLVLIIASIAVLIIESWLRSPYACLPAGVLVAAVLLLHFAPDDDEGDGGS
jgi:hypothetical protein